MRTTVVRKISLLLVFALFAVLPSLALAQVESKSVPLVKELAQLLDAKKLDAIAAKDPSGKDAYAAALYFQGSQLLVVQARYAVPPILDEKLTKKDYRDVYTDLNSACIEGSRTLVIDTGADGLKPKKDENRFDQCDMGPRSFTFDGDWKKQKMNSEEDYNKAFSEADDKYAKILAALIAQAKKQ
jgi:hypothetical protein